VLRCAHDTILRIPASTSALRTILWDLFTDRARYGPVPEMRPLDAIRPVCANPLLGPDPVYAIAMDVGRVRPARVAPPQHALRSGLLRCRLSRRRAVRSQGHVHRSPLTVAGRRLRFTKSGRVKLSFICKNMSPMIPGAVGAIQAVGPILLSFRQDGLTPHQPNTHRSLSFGASLCDREYGFDYDGVRKRRVWPWYACVDAAGHNIRWERNPNYDSPELEIRPPSDYSAFGFSGKTPLYLKSSRFRSFPMDLETRPSSQPVQDFRP